ncbi:protachykinin [Mastacembelus armatus]|uniref:protachykinin n=1 Tax=Mastacembelus armatus TaxID=205130 RepID=UPI000E456615|nr:protachykinin-like [Mastacembelus armatus]
MMERVKLFLILVLILKNVFCQEMDVNWREGREEDKWPNSAEIQDILVRMVRKPGPRQHLGLMGKKESAKTQMTRKRHKFHFVGLMGKRSFEEKEASVKSLRIF